MPPSGADHSKKSEKSEDKLLSLLNKAVIDHLD